MGALPIAEFVSSASSASDSDRSAASDEDCLVDDGDGDLVADSRLVSSVRALLQGLGEDLSRNGLIKTPSRVANAFLSATKGYGLSAEQTIGGALFAEAGPGNGKGGGCGGMVVVRNIELFSTCESCLLPFKLCCHIAYIPSEQRVVGLSKLPRVAEIFAARLQSPDRLANEIAGALWDGFKPLGVAVVGETWHLECPRELRSSKEPASWIRRSVCARKGSFEDDDRGSEDWQEFVAMLQLSGSSQLSVTKKPAICPLLAGDAAAERSSHPNFETMVEAVVTLLRALGEDPTREELKLTPSRYVRWLLASTHGSRLSRDFILGNGVAAVEQDGDHHVTMVAVLDLPFCSQCEHHLLPFSGVAHVGVLPAKNHPSSHPRASRGILEKIVKLYSCRLQVQERLTRQIADAVMSSTAASGVMVVVEAGHVCMISRGVKKTGSTTGTLATMGDFAVHGKKRAEFLQMIATANSSK
ncbi:hypothetical protein SELMODRAFT_76344 [Selaginella moellendorffii]|uniref:GTP cyclohydrolase 1 n=1 Tax=Selaginella moellendorffii TaxID=88036 RepID=D8QRM4_SELML|nr:GTP cyclohydrolase 1 [Selaginella moellendorffii]EFJ37277.1 hypothetical protein SELMODRAFT_76344 [Selaginella moellendorffii]|eukprot:XP_002962017.1 GTP cyclohydrolase 1 [Selaginella moellendorffii]